MIAAAANHMTDRLCRLRAITTLSVDCSSPMPHQRRETGNSK